MDETTQSTLFTHEDEADNDYNPEDHGSTDSNCLTRTFQDGEPIYHLHPPESLVDDQAVTGYIHRSIRLENENPAIVVNLDPDLSGDSNSYAFSPGLPLQIPRSFAEVLAPRNIKWRREDNELIAELTENRSIKSSPSTHPVRKDGDSYTLLLPYKQSLETNEYCSVRLSSVNGELVFEIYPSDNRVTGGFPISDIPASPRISVPDELAASLGFKPGSQLPVVVHDIDDTAPELVTDVVESPSSTVSITDRGVLDVPSTLRTEGKTTSETVPISISMGGTDLPRVTADIDSDAGDSDGLSAVVSDGNLIVDRELLSLIGLDDGDTVYWTATDDGDLVFEWVPSEPLAPHADRSEGLATRGTEDEKPPKFTIPDSVLSGMSGSDISPTITTTVSGRSALEFTSGGESELVSVSEEDGIRVLSISDVAWSLLSLGSDSEKYNMKWVNAGGRVTGIPVTRGGDTDETETSLRDHIMSETGLYIPSDGMQHHVRQFSGGDNVIGLPNEAQSEMGLSEGVWMNLSVESRGSYLTIQAEPVPKEEASSEMCTGRMLSGSSMKLPVQLVSSLSLFDRSVSWGFDQTGDGLVLVGVLQPLGASDIESGEFVANGTVYGEEKGEAGSVHYYFTIPTKAVERLTPPGMGRPEGVFVGYDMVDGRPRFLLYPLTEEDLDIESAVRISDFSDGFVRATLTKSLAVATPVEDGDKISWTLTDDSLVGTRR